ncbi:MAG TPA: PE domain-containing protein [Mycobacterium sp.]|uniref:PPE family protein, SVP subgroup n=1 Tax=Mycobacterium sp. TaxID=1785 RepID=UPI002C093F82|nr:PE domain-containing protein [Mycobacterium sp.]HXO82223.1 PE domain-containing protein [Mycobacterium sp.]
MAFVNTQPAAIAAAATQLEGIGNSFAAESAGAATSTTDVVPAASDEVSILQAGVFSTYGQLYQSVSAQAQAIHQQFVQLLNQSSGSYQETEAANQAGAAANSLSNATSGASSAAGTAATDPIESLANFINGVSSALSGSFFGSNIGNLTNVQVGNWASAGSDLIGLGGGGLLTALAGPATAGSDIGGLGSALAGNVAPVGGMGGAGAAMGAAPVLAAAGQGSSIGALSVPPTWAGGAGIPAASTPVTLASQSWATPPPATGGMTNGIAGMPAVANGGRGGSSFGAPRYGVKPKVMPAVPKPTIT